MSGSAGIWRLEWCSLNKVYPVQTSEIQWDGCVCFSSSPFFFF